MKYTIKWESNGKKPPILWEKQEHQVPRFLPYDGFCCIFLYYGKLMGNPMHFLFDEILMGIVWGIIWGKSTHTMGKVQFPSSPHAMGFCYIFPYYEKLMGKPVHFPYNKVYHRMGIYEKKAPILWEKYEYQFTRLSSYHGFCCIFPYCGKFMWKPMHSSYDDIG